MMLYRLKKAPCCFCGLPLKDVSYGLNRNPLLLVPRRIGDERQACVGKDGGLPRILALLMPLPQPH